MFVKYYKKQSDYESALKYSEQKSLAEKEYIDKKQAMVMAYQTVAHNNFAKSKEIECLNSKNKLLSAGKGLSARVAFSQKLIILFLILLVGFILLWSYKNRKIQKMYKYLSETDNMTGIYNRKGFKDFAESLLLQSKKEGLTVAIVMRASSTGHDFVITASFGVASTNASGYVYSKLLSDADHAMYDAKISGRNMVVNYKYNPI